MFISDFLYMYSTLWNFPLFPFEGPSWCNGQGSGSREGQSSSSKSERQSSGYCWWNWGEIFIKNYFDIIKALVKKIKGKIKFDIIFEINWEKCFGIILVRIKIFGQILMKKKFGKRNSLLTKVSNVTYEDMWIQTYLLYLTYNWEVSCISIWVDIYKKFVKCLEFYLLPYKASNYSENNFGLWFWPSS